MDVTRVMRDINMAFNLISHIPVMEENVEIMSDAKAALRRAYSALKKQKEDEDGGCKQQT